MKQTVLYIRYFFYIGWNWNFRLAWVILKHEIRGEKKYGIHTTGYDDLSKSLSQKERTHASVYQPINYLIAEWLLEQITKEEITNGHLLDAGCGKGRFLAMAAHRGFPKVTGIDLSAAMCHDAVETTEKIQRSYKHLLPTQFFIDQADAAQYSPAQDVNVIFLFNPFDQHILKPFIQHVVHSLRKHPRTMKILYANPEYKALWIKAGFKEMKSIEKLKWLQACVLVWQGPQ